AGEPLGHPVDALLARPDLREQRLHREEQDRLPLAAIRPGTRKQLWHWRGPLYAPPRPRPGRWAARRLASVSDRLSWPTAVGRAGPLADLVHERIGTADFG